MPAESALLIEVPEAEPLVGSWRLRYDSSASHGIPAHVTVLYPFVPPERIDAATLETVRDLATAHEPFTFLLTRLRTFPGVLWLAPEPDAPVRRLTEAVVGEFPGYPPYRGTHAEVIPHVTVAESGDPVEFDTLRRGIGAALVPRLPLPARATHVALYVCDENWTWRPVRRFALGS